MLTINVLTDSRDSRVERIFSIGRKSRPSIAGPTSPHLSIVFLTVA